VTLEETKEQAIKHIRLCDQLFDGNGIRPDKEFAYLEMRLLALELLDLLEKGE